MNKISERPKLETADYWDFIPGISTGKSVIDLALRCFFIPCMNENTLKKYSYCAHINKKASWKIIAGLLPVIGNIFLVCMHWRSKTDVNLMFKPSPSTSSQDETKFAQEKHYLIPATVIPSKSIPLSEPFPTTLKDLSSFDLRAFPALDSTRLVPLNGCTSRQHFMERAIKEGSSRSLVIVSISPELVPPGFEEHLMRNKKPLAIEKKYEFGDRITNMEGALHTVIVPITHITMAGDSIFSDGHRVAIIEEGMGRKVILSATINPDLECAGDSEVIMRIVAAGGDSFIKGKKLLDGFKPLWEQVNGNHKEFAERLPEYEKQLQSHMIYHLMADHEMPSLKYIRDFELLIEPKMVLKSLDTMIQKTTDIREEVKDKFVNLNGHIISLEAMFSLYAHQIKNECSVLEKVNPQGYVYTISPPKVFAAQIGAENVRVLNRLQILAFKHLKQNSSSFENLKIIGFGDYDDKAIEGHTIGAVALLKHVFPEKDVRSKSDLFLKPSGIYSVEQPFALVVKNNSDAFGNNILNERGIGSLDAGIGMNSDAAVHLTQNPIFIFV